MALGLCKVGITHQLKHLKIVHGSGSCAHSIFHEFNRLLRAPIRNPATHGLVVGLDLLLLHGLAHAFSDIMLNLLFIRECWQSLSFPDALLLLEMLVDFLLVILPDVRVLLVVFQLPNVSSLLKLDA